ncbi:uncharacterized protein LOC143281208 [Babylonia areolata]|uniref:uncharacterized protein LOC143281208 n=1 Tax=Babylonia areolata TaxID=304850 RepID=UPI003FD370CD
MASVEQSTEMEKSSDSAPLSHSASQNSLMEAGQAQSHMHDVRVPELVYNIDEETRMGPENNNDGVNTLSTESPAKEREGKAVEPKAAPKEEPPTANPAAVNTFSALSFIASQYAESDNSSPRSSDSPAGMQEEGCGGVGPEPPEATGNSSDGFDTSSLMLAQDAPGVSLHTQAQRDVDTPSVTADRGGVDKSVVQGDVDKSSVTAVQGGVDTVQGAGEKSSVTPAQGAVDSSLTQAKGSVSCEQFAGVQVKEEKICSEKVGPWG